MSVEGMIVQCSLILCLHIVMVGTKKYLFFNGMMDCDLLLDWIDIGKLVSVKGIII